MYDQQNRLRLHNTADGSQEMLLRGARSPLRALSWAPNRNILATGEEDGTVRLWEAGFVDRSWQVGGQGIESALHISPNGLFATGATHEKVAVVVNFVSGGLKEIPGTEKAVPVSIGNDGSLLCLMRQPDDSLLSLTEWRDGKSAARIVFPNSQSWPLSLNNETQLYAGHWLIIQEKEQHLRAVDITDGSLTWTATAEWDFLRAALSPDARTLAFSQDRKLRLLDWPSAKQQREIDTGEKVLALTFSADGTAIITGGADGVIRLFAAEDLHPAGTLTGHTGGINSLKVSADNTRLASSAADSRVRLWDLKTLQPLGRLPAVDIGPRSVGGFTNGDRGVAALMWGGPLVVWRGTQ
jgi:WD40 repeat protein